VGRSRPSDGHHQGHRRMIRTAFSQFGGTAAFSGQWRSTLLGIHPDSVRKLNCFLSRKFRFHQPCVNTSGVASTRGGTSITPAQWHPTASRRIIMRIVRLCTACFCARDRQSGGEKQISAQKVSTMRRNFNQRTSSTGGSFLPKEKNDT
jgi:hypothetical protein